MRSTSYCSIKNKVDYIIVGQGLAGSCLALQLVKRGAKIFVFDEPGKNVASSMAAGLVNPITGKFLKQSWMADKIFPSLFQFYKEVEDLLQQRFFFPMPIYRPFISIEEQNEWMVRSEDKLLKKFISKIETSSVSGWQVKDPFGGVISDVSGYLDTVSFMESTRNFLKNRSSHSEKSFDFEKLILQKEKVLYEDIEAKKIIFCDGTRVKANPFLKWIPVLPLKGETLTISLPEKPEVIFNRGVYIVPANDRKVFTVGATYDPNDNIAEITVAARNELEEKLKELIKIPFTINHQNWGMRPTTPDRRPILGPHPELENLIIFNGLGTKGVSLGPYFSCCLVAWLEGLGEIPMEVNIERFKSLYSKFSSAII